MRTDKEDPWNAVETQARNSVTLIPQSFHNDQFSNAFQIYMKYAVCNPYIWEMNKVWSLGSQKGLRHVASDWMNM